jgi:hypothetical protein
LLAEVPDFSVESVFLRIFRQMKKSSRKIKEVMQMNIFETVKAAVTVRQAAEHYGPPSVVAQVKKYRPRVNQSKQDELFCMNVLSGYLHLLEDWKERYAPEAPEDEPDERFVEACHKLEYVEYLNDLLLMSDQEERTDTVKELLTDGTIARMQTRLDEQKKEVRCHVREQEIA